MFDVVTPDVKRGGTKRKRKIPRSSVPAAKKAAAGLLWLLVFAKLSSVYSTEFMLSDEFTTYSFSRRFVASLGVWRLSLIGIKGLVPLDVWLFCAHKVLRRMVID